MLKVTSVLESEYCVQLPEILCTNWELDADAELYASVSNGKLLITKERQKSTVVIIPLSVEMGIIIPEFLFHALNLQIGGHITLTLNDEVLTLSGSNIIDFHSTAQLEKKLEREFKALVERPIGKRYFMMLEDVMNFLIYNELEDELVAGLLNKPNPLLEIAFMVRDDEELGDIIDARIKEKAWEYIRSDFENPPESTTE